VSERFEHDGGGRRWAAVCLWLLTVALSVGGAIDASRNTAVLADGPGLVGLLEASAVIAAGVGAIVAAKSGNRVGWLLAGGGLALSAGLAAMVSGSTSCETGNVATGVAVLAVGGPALWWACTTTSVALFPTGALGQGRRAALRAVGPILAWAGAAVVIVAASTSPARSFRALGFGTCSGEAGSRAHLSGFSLLIAGFVVAAVTGYLAAVRLRGDERGRSAPVVLLAGLALIPLGRGIVDGARPFSGLSYVAVAAAFVGLGIPAAVAVSVVRYRAFGIYRLAGYLADYRLWTAGQASLAVAAAASIGAAATALVGLSRRPVAVALATLAAAAAIFPLWRRRQAVVDARFGQHQPDRAAALETLAARLTDEHLDPLRGPVFDLLRRFAPVVIVEGADGMRFAVRTDDGEIGRHTFVHGAYDLDTMRRAIDLLRTERDTQTPLAGRTVLDVGANIGISVVPLLLLFGAERGIAVEPEPRNLEMLRLNLALNDLAERVKVMPFGLSDRDGSLQLELSSGNPGDHRMRVPGAPPTEETATRSSVEVPVRRLDALVASGEVDAASLGLIWVDVQGHEGHVLAGARTVLETPVPVVSEFWPSELRRSDGLDLFKEIVTTCFTRIVDLRAAEAGSPAVASSRIGELAERYPGPGDFTDLLLLP